MDGPGVTLREATLGPQSARGSGAATAAAFPPPGNERRATGGMSQRRRTAGRDSPAADSPCQVAVGTILLRRTDAVNRPPIDTLANVLNTPECRDEQILA
jgi:hypothetical protein